MPVTVVRELYSIMAAEDAAGGYIVTSGRVSRDAIALAEGRDLVLIVGTRRHKLLPPAALMAAFNAVAP